jgi:hypothetical protein
VSNIYLLIVGIIANIRSIAEYTHVPRYGLDHVDSQDSRAC